jgi:hypothetical protein
MHLKEAHHARKEAVKPRATWHATKRFVRSRSLLVHHSRTGFQAVTQSTPASASAYSNGSILAVGEAEAQVDLGVWGCQLVASSRSHVLEAPSDQSWYEPHSPRRAMHPQQASQLQYLSLCLFSRDHHERLRCIKDAALALQLSSASFGRTRSGLVVTSRGKVSGT